MRNKGRGVFRSRFKDSWGKWYCLLGREDLEIDNLGSIVFRVCVRWRKRM